MTEVAREQNKLYQREWRKKNKEKTSQYNRRYWEKRAERLKKEGEPIGQNFSVN